MFAIKACILHVVRLSDVARASKLLNMALPESACPCKSISSTRVFVQAYFDALVETGTVSLPNGVSESTLEQVMFLLRAPNPSRGLSKVCIECTIPASSTAVVSEALLHHSTSINSLNLLRTQKGALYGVLHAMSQLSRLSYLQLSLPAHCRQDPYADPTIISTVNRLASTISNLSSLAEVNLHVVIQSAENHSPPSKRPKLVSASSTATSPDPVMQALSAAPNLTSLTLAIAFVVENSAFTLWSGMSGPFLGLQQLKITTCSRFKAPACKCFPSISLLPAMTNLCLEYGPALVADCGHMQDLLQQTALQSLELDFYLLDGPASEILQEGLHKLTRLSQLTIEFGGRLEDWPDRIHNTIKGVAALPALYSLDLEVPDIANQNDAGWSSADVHEQLLQPLSQCSSLKHLRCRLIAWLQFHIPGPAGVVDGAASASLVSRVLPAATQLTHLELVATNGDSDDANVADGLLQGMPALPELRHLKLSALFFESDHQVLHSTCRSAQPSIPCAFLNMLLVCLYN